MNDDESTQSRKPFELQYYVVSWGGWRGLRRDWLCDDPAEFDTVEEGRELAQSAAASNGFRTRVVRRADHQVVAEYAVTGLQVK